MRPCKAKKGHRARRVTMELAYCSSLTFHTSSSFHFQFLKRHGAPAHIFFQAIGSDDLTCRVP